MRNPKVYSYNIHSHRSELVRRIKAAKCTLDKARLRAATLARALWDMRNAGLEPSATLRDQHSQAVAQRVLIAQLLRELQRNYKTRYGKRFVSKRVSLAEAEKERSQAL